MSDCCIHRRLRPIQSCFLSSSRRTTLVHSINVYHYCITLYAIHIEPTAPPLNVSYGGRTNVSITLIWNPPPFEHQNGQIRSYSIIITYPLSETQRLLTTNSSYTNFTIGGLQPYSSYLFSIAAETISLGPYSNTINVSTVEGSML
jgi:hypothetical protein